MERTPGSIVATHVVMTGPIQGPITLDDGTVVDVTEEWIDASTPEQAAEIADKVSRHYEANGHPMVEGEFRYDAPKTPRKKKG